METTRNTWERIYDKNAADLRKTDPKAWADYPADLPVAVVYFAGYHDKEKVVKSKLSGIADEVRKIDEKWLGLVIIGEAAR